MNGFGVRRLCAEAFSVNIPLFDYMAQEVMNSWIEEKAMHGNCPGAWNDKNLLYISFLKTI
jgi:hypothetical protein